jgi:hypothetical protein
VETTFCLAKGCPTLENQKQADAIIKADMASSFSFLSCGQRDVRQSKDPETSYRDFVFKTDWIASSARGHMTGSAGMPLWNVLKQILECYQPSMPRLCSHHRITTDRRV